MSIGIVLDQTLILLARLPRFLEFVESMIARWVVAPFGAIASTSVSLRDAQAIAAEPVEGT